MAGGEEEVRAREEMKGIMSGGEGEEKVDARRRMVGGEGVRAREEMKYIMSGAKKRRKK